jgi:hypothetical protein
MKTPNITPGPWLAIEGDTFNPDRPWGVSRYLPIEAVREIDGDEAEPNSRTEVIAEVCDGPAAAADAVAIAALPTVLFSLEWIMTRLERGGKAAVSDAISQARAALLAAGYTEPVPTP